MTRARILLGLAWAFAQLVGLLVGGWALLGAQYGQGGTALLGVLMLAGPIVVAGGALILSGRAADPGAGRTILFAASALLALAPAALLLTILGSRQG